MSKMLDLVDYLRCVGCVSKMLDVVDRCHGAYHDLKLNVYMRRDRSPFTTLG